MRFTKTQGGMELYPQFDNHGIIEIDSCLKYGIRNFAQPLNNYFSATIMITNGQTQGIENAAPLNNFGNLHITDLYGVGIRTTELFTNHGQCIISSASPPYPTTSIGLLLNFQGSYLDNASASLTTNGFLVPLQIEIDSEMTTSGILDVQ